MLPNRLHGILRSWRLNERGVAGVEFAFMAPLMIIMFLGVFEAARAYVMYSRFMTATSVVGDLVANEISLTAEQMVGVYDVVTPIMGGYPSTANLFEIKLIPIIPDKTSANNPPRVYAKVASRNAIDGEARCSVAANLTPEEKELVASKFVNGVIIGGVIKVVGTYTYKPVLNYIWQSVEVPWTSEAIYNPRSNCVTFPGNQKCTPC